MRLASLTFCAAAWLAPEVAEARDVRLRIRTLPTSDSFNVLVIRDADASADAPGLPLYSRINQALQQGHEARFETGERHVNSVDVHLCIYWNGCGCGDLHGVELQPPGRVPQEIVVHIEDAGLTQRCVEALNAARRRGVFPAALPTAASSSRASSSSLRIQFPWGSSEVPTTYPDVHDDGTFLRMLDAAELARTGATSTPVRSGGWLRLGIGPRALWGWGDDGSPTALAPTLDLSLAFARARRVRLGADLELAAVAAAPSDLAELGLGALRARLSVAGEWYPSPPWFVGLGLGGALAIWDLPNQDPLGGVRVSARTGLQLLEREAGSLWLTASFGYEHYPASSWPHQVDLGAGVAWSFGQ